MRLHFSISRSGGTFGGVIVHYELYFTPTNEKAQDGGDFSQATNLSVRFERGERTQYIAITPRVDNEPEVGKTYTIRLVRVTGGSSGLTDYWLN